ncbi:hypothetical protein IEO21_05093 [Rhodonia placenta]|uniref:Uncharacterized protein n=1 Tax=Rhodonia placenta TaxID=104341 RepID=A0A8H7U2L7_9APHY|nr:hypothetical protein IEO21_05093 [Postia placenta]
MVVRRSALRCRRYISLSSRGSSGSGTMRTTRRGRTRSGTTYPSIGASAESISPLRNLGREVTGWLIIPRERGTSACVSATRGPPRQNWLSVRKRKLLLRVKKIRVQATTILPLRRRIPAPRRQVSLPRPPPPSWTLMIPTSIPLSETQATSSEKVAPDPGLLGATPGAGTLPTPRPQDRPR